MNMFMKIGCLVAVLSSLRGLAMVELHEAMKRGPLGNVQEFVAAEVDVNKKDVRGNVPLHYAAMSGNLPVIQTLIAAGADIELQDSHGETPIEIAFRLGHSAIVEYIIAYMNRVQKVHARAPMIRCILAMAAHKRLGAESLFVGSPRIVQNIADLTTQAELYDAAQPEQTKSN